MNKFDDEVPKADLLAQICSVLIHLSFFVSLGHLIWNDRESEQLNAAILAAGAMVAIAIIHRPQK